MRQSVPFMRRRNRWRAWRAIDAEWVCCDASLNSTASAWRTAFCAALSCLLEEPKAERATGSVRTPLEVSAERD